LGIQKEPAEFVASLPLPKGFSVCELGDQAMCGGPTKTALSKDWYAERGCGRYVSIDGNGRGTFTADLNQPLIVEELGCFDLVTDFGTGEHIFDQAQVWRTMHDLTKPGGYIAFDRPAQGYQKHCFYLTNECLFRDLAAANGYAVIWLERQTMTRGELIRGVFQLPTHDRPFAVPQQGRYQDDLVIG
jgi:SAM-dependent methyltransferase